MLPELNWIISYLGHLPTANKSLSNLSKPRLHSGPCKPNITNAFPSHLLVLSSFPHRSLLLCQQQCIFLLHDTFSTNRNALWKLPLNFIFPFDFFVALPLRSESCCFLLFLLIMVLHGNRCSASGECSSSPSLSPLSPLCPGSHTSPFLWKQALLVCFQQELISPLTWPDFPCSVYLFMLATSCCHLEHCSIGNLKSILLFMSSGKIFQSLTLPYSCLHRARATSSTVSSPFVLGLCSQLLGLPSSSADMRSCVLHTYSFSHHTCYTPLIVSRRTSDILVFYTWNTFPDCML